MTNYKHVNSLVTMKRRFERVLDELATLRDQHLIGDDELEPIEDIVSEQIDTFSERLFEFQMVIMEYLEDENDKQTEGEYRKMSFYVDKR